MTTVAGTSTAIGELIATRIEFLSQNAIIAVQTADAVRCELAQMPMEMAIAVRKRMNVMNVNTFTSLTEPAGTFTVFCPILASTLRRVRMALDLTKMNDVTVRVVYQGASASAGLATATVTAFSSKLWMSYHNYELEYYEKLRSDNFKNNSLLNMVTTDFYRETIPANAVTTSTIDIRCNGAAIWSSVYLLGPDGTVNPVYSGTIRANGTSVYEDVPSIIMNLDQDYTGSSAIAITSSAAATEALHVRNPGPIYTFRHGLVKSEIDPNSVWQSGIVNFRGLSNPQFTVTHPSIANATLVVVHKVLTILTVSQDGSVRLTTTS